MFKTIIYCYNCLKKHKYKNGVDNDTNRMFGCHFTIGLETLFFFFLIF
jgi:hypothetical protein